MLLFYRYFEAEPELLPVELSEIVGDFANDMAQFQRKLCTGLDIKGKLRFGIEGFNITLFVLKRHLAAYTKACMGHWSFAKLDLSTEEKQNAFFKPSPSCKCAFQTLSIKTVEEITPFHRAVPFDEVLIYLHPEEFHERLLTQASDCILLDARNHYESRLGSFESPLTETVLPPTRRFSELPPYLKNTSSRFKEVPGIYTYCTGGIRCEKSARFIAGVMREASDLNTPVYTLRGGINAYLTWMDDEIRSGRRNMSESLFKGRNYVFDGRGHIGLQTEATSGGRACAGCAQPTWSLGQCKGFGCHLDLLVCGECVESKGGAWCCSSCKDVSEAAVARGRRKGNCECEMQRAKRLTEPL